MLKLEIPFSKEFFLFSFWSPGRKRPERIERFFYPKNLIYRRITVEPGLLWSDSKVYCLLLGLYLKERKEKLELPTSKLLLYLGRGFSNASYSSLNKSLNLLKEVTIKKTELSLNLEEKNTEEVKLIDELKRKGNKVEITLSQSGLETFLSKKENFLIPLKHLLDNRLKGLSYSLLVIGYYFYYSKLSLVNFGEEISEFGKKWFGTQSKGKTFIKRLKNAVEVVNQIRELPFKLEISKSGKYLKIQKF